ncbi:hypothetical protein MKW92_028558, partial [Papaver armeniacum]
MQRRHLSSQLELIYHHFLYQVKMSLSRTQCEEAPNKNMEMKQKLRVFLREGKVFQMKSKNTGFTG